MKLHITEDQFNELSSKGKDALKGGGWHEEINDLVFTEKLGLNIRKDVMDEEGLYLFPSIGQMLEFIHDHEDKVAGEMIPVPGENLCDELWEQAKRILEG